MRHQDTPLDPDFIQQQRQALETLQAELQASVEFREDDEDQLQAERANQTHASGGDAQQIALQDNSRAVSAHALKQLDAVRRALEKIDEGTYGKSEESGDPIPRARLEALPASLYTVEEEEARERDARRAE